jgi:hypothetical protein
MSTGKVKIAFGKVEKGRYPEDPNHFAVYANGSMVGEVTAHKNRKNCCEPYQVVAYEFEPFAEGEDEITICTWADSERRGWKRLRSPAEAKQDLKKVLSARYL